MTQPTLDLDKLATAFGQSSRKESDLWLDAETGEVLSVDPAAFERARRGEEVDDDLAHAILLGEGGRYRWIPCIHAHDAYQDRLDFLAELGDSKLSRRLFHELHQYRPFHRFRDVLTGHAGARRRWQAFQRRRMRERITAWLQAEGLIE